MKCHQCERPALYAIGEPAVPLCLSCYRQLAEINHLAFLQNAAMLNQAMNDMDSVIGFGTRSGRIPVAEIARAMHKGSTYNSIQVSGSQIGVLSTGDLAKIDAAITLTRDTDVELIGDPLKRFTEAVVNDASTPPELKKDLIELIEALSSQVLRERKKPVIMALLESIRDKAASVGPLVQLAANLSQAVTNIFGSSD